MAVAEELHFGRAAMRLGIAQPALSKAVHRLEARLGVRLLKRDSRNVSLTPAGHALLRDGRYALGAMRAAAEGARRTGDGHAHLRLVIKPGGDANLLSAILAAYAETPDARQVDLIFGGNTDRADHVRDGRADVGLLYAPFDDLHALEHVTLHVEGRVAILPEGHALATRSRLASSDLTAEPRFRWRGLDDGATGPEVADLAQMLPLIAVGRAIAILPRSLVTPVPRGLVTVPVTDAPGSRLVLAWAEHRRSGLVNTFVESALRAATTAASPR